MLNQNNLLKILDNNTNIVAAIIIILLILVVHVIVYFICSELDKRKIYELNILREEMSRKKALIKSKNHTERSN